MPSSDILPDDFTIAGSECASEDEATFLNGDGDGDDDDWQAVDDDAIDDNFDRFRECAESLEENIQGEKVSEKIKKETKPKTTTKTKTKTKKKTQCLHTCMRIKMQARDDEGRRRFAPNQTRMRS